MVVLLFSGDLVFGRDVLCAVAHRDFVVHVVQAVDNERVLRLEVTESWSMPRDKKSAIRRILSLDLRSVGHTLHATCDHDTSLTELNAL